MAIVRVRGRERVLSRGFLHFGHVVLERGKRGMNLVIGYRL